MKTFISYEGLPINSGGAHTFKDRNAEENYSHILEFLKKYASRINEEQIGLTLYKSAEKRYSIIKNLFIISLKLGIPKYRNDGLYKFWTWNLSKKQIQKGFEFLKLNKQLPQSPIGPFSLNFCWNFYFKDAQTEVELPNQKLIPEIDFRLKNSRIYLRISEKTTVSVWFAFPFEKITEYEKNYLKNLKASLPFKMSEKHWKIWKLSKNEKWTSQNIEIGGKTFHINET